MWIRLSYVFLVKSGYKIIIDAMEEPVRDSNLAEKLEQQADSNRPILSSIEGGRDKMIDPLDEVTFRKTKRQHIREFGSVIALALVIIAAYKLYKSASPQTILTLCASSAVFYSLCALAPRLMHPVFIGWMRFAKVLEVVMTKVILGLMWAGTFLPIGIAFKILGRSPMTLGFEPARLSYWEQCDKSRNDFALLERQY